MATLQSILAEYDLKRGRAEYEARLARERLFSSVAELKELDEKKTTLLMENMKAALYGKARDIRAEVAALAKEIDETAARYGLASGSLKPQYECALCKDSGYVEVEGKKKFCSCLINRIYREIYHARPIDELPDLLRPLTFLYFPGNIGKRWKRF